ncbi:glycosyltransferase family 2 protein [uncultured Aquimarina sp.]|uniref:glycosyltransferase family 2 protein n=1 Tax=uncultured Aquimarina sp. TaxID=575652 RepID=UPI00261C3A47|nr:glycosyltransferase family 2 protein [uncultured Aquimarina sp.]
MKKELTIGILLWNSRDHLEDLYSSIAIQSIINDISVLIVDNGSSDSCVEYTKAFFKDKNIDFRLIENKTNLGFCKGANQLIDAISSEYFILLNSDVKFEEKYFEVLLTALKESDSKTIGAIPKALYFYDEERINNFGNDFSPFKLWQGVYTDKLDESIIKDYECTGGLFISPIFKTDLLKSIGCFIPEFGSYGEDFDVSYRSRVLGYKWLAISDAIIYHKFQASIKDNNVDRRKWFINGFRNAFYVLLINFQLLNLIYVIPIFFARIILRYNIYSFQNNYSFIKTNVYFVKSFFRKSDYKWVKQYRKKVQSKRQLSDIEIWKI